LGRTPRHLAVLRDKRGSPVEVEKPHLAAVLSGSAEEAHRRLEDALQAGEALEMPVADDRDPVRFSAEVVEKVVVW